MIDMKALSTTLIGSTPYDDPALAVDMMKDIDIPATPQMVRLSPWEDMLLGAVSGLPALLVDEAAVTVRAKAEGREDELAEFYTKFFTGDYGFLGLPPQSSRGFTAMLDRAQADPDYGPAFLKSQVIGPLTFGQMVHLDNGEKALVDDPELLEATARALGGKAAWEAARIRETGRTPVIFIDEPGLASFGSAFCSLTEETVVETLGLACDLARSEGPALVGCHICGNTDWGMMTRTGLDIINFDAYNFMENFVLYPKPLAAFLEKGGRVAWGVVPAEGFSLDITPESLAEKLHRGWLELDRKGLDYELIKSRAILTAACGLSTLSPALADGVFKILPRVQALMESMKK